jgi:serine/threonine protein kinase
LRKSDKKYFVKVIGYCDEEDQQISIYEYMPGGTLHEHLHSKLPHSILGNAGIRSILNIIFQDISRSHEI